MSVKPTLFVGSSVEGLDYAYAVQENLEHDAVVTVWNQGVFVLSGSTLESLVMAVSNSDFGAFVLGADDIATIRSQAHSVPRDNVIFELGLFVGALGRSRTFILTPRAAGAVKLPTDLLGVTAATFDADRPDRNYAAALGVACNGIRRVIRDLGRASDGRLSSTPTPLSTGGADTGDVGTRNGTPEVPKRHPTPASEPAGPKSAIASRMVDVPAGVLNLGDDTAGRVRVAIQRPFSIGRHLVTQGLYAKVMGVNPSHFKGDDLPVERVSWNDAIAFCNGLSKQDGLEPVYDVANKVVAINLDRNGYRLPTEAEWEYACLGGQRGQPYGPLELAAWYVKNSDATTHPVGLKAENGLGLCDMLGNVWEWCGDWYQKRAPMPGLIGDPTGAESGVERLLRGGSWNSVPKNVTASYRFRRDPSSREDDAGFRVVRSNGR